MQKTNEEILKALEKNYQTVQIAELNVYDKNTKLNKQFKKEVKDLESKLKEELKVVAQEETELSAGFRQQEVELKTTESSLQKSLDDKILVAKATYESSIKAISDSNEKEVIRLNEVIKAIKKDNTKLIADVLKEYNKSVEASKKVIITINEKGVKDQTTFTAKIEDLRTKHEQKLEDLKAKEAVKIQKLTEASDKQVLKLQDSIKDEQEKYANKLAQLHPIYEEELAEIDENMESKKFEYQTKHESIRTSADQRIAVREKHLHRAMDDNDQRSVKQHKKDIEKFRKEADRDLVLLRKSHKSDEEQSSVYRKNFIKENLEKLADIEKEHNNVLELKQKDIEDTRITLVFNIENTNLEYEKLEAEALNVFNQSFIEVRTKQEEVLKQKEIDLDKEEDTQKKLLIEFDKTNLVNEEKQHEAIEQKSKELRVETISKTKNEIETKDTLNNEEATLNNQKEIAKFELEKDLKVILKQEIIVSHKQEHKKLSSFKEEFLTYQSQLVPLYTDRAKEIFGYDEQEVTNRYQLKIAFLEKQIESLDRNYETVVKKINDVLVVERAPFDTIINSIAGSQKDELNVFEEAHQEKAQEIEDKLASLNDRKEKKLRKLYEDELETLNSAFKAAKKTKEVEISKSVGIYEQALNAAIARNEEALKAAKDFNDSEDSRLKTSIDLLKTNKANELEDSKLRIMQSEGNLQEFLTKSATRNTSNTEDNQLYYDQKVAIVESHVNQTKSDFEELRENANNQYNLLLKGYSDQKANVLSDLLSEQNREESSFESLKQDLENKKGKYQSDSDSNVSLETNKTNDKANAITKRYDVKIQVVNDEFSRQSNEFNSHLNDISKKMSASNETLASEKKRVLKDYEASLKAVLSSITKKLSEDIAAL